MCFSRELNTCKIKKANPNGEWAFIKCSDILYIPNTFLFLAIKV